MSLAVQVKNDFGALIDRVRARFPSVPVSEEEFDSGTMSVYFDLPDGDFLELEYSSAHEAFGISRISDTARTFTGHDEVFATLPKAESRLCELLAETTS